MRIGIFPDGCVFAGDPEERKWLDTALAFEIPGAHWSAKRKGWDGKRHFLTNADWFPAGFVPYVVKAARQDAQSVSLQDHRFTLYSMAKEPKSWQGPPLRDYQHAAIKRVRASRVERLRWPRGVLEMPTGSGKTWTQAWLAGCYPGRVLYFVHLRGLMHQTAKEFETVLKEPVGWIGDMDMHRPQSRIVISIIDSMALRLRQYPVMRQYMKQVGMLLVDEAHHIDKGRWYSVLKRCYAPYRLAFTGTAFRRKDLGNVYLMATMGDLLYRLDKAPLIQAGHLSQPVLLRLHIPGWLDVKGSGPFGWSHHDLRRQGIAGYEPRNSAFADAIRDLCRHGHSVLVMTEEIAHGEYMEERLSRQGLRVAFIRGASSRAERESALKRLEQKSLQALVTSRITDEGINVPSLDAVALMGGGSSEIKFVQRIGRGMRPKEENYTVVIDADDAHHERLGEHSAERLRLAQEEGYIVVKSKGKLPSDLWTRVISVARRRTA